MGYLPNAWKGADKLWSVNWNLSLTRGFCMTQSSVYQLHADGVSLIVDTSSGTPVIAHWGKDVGLEKLEDQVQAILSDSIPYASIDQPQTLVFGEKTQEVS
jgi:hypothetical protein